MEQYIHLLIARPDSFAPTSAQIKSFSESMLAFRIVTQLETVSLRTPSDKVRTGTNPFTGKTVSIPISNHLHLENLGDFEAAAKGLIDYCLDIEGSGFPETAPVPISFKDAYTIAIRCNACSVPRSTSDICDDEQSSSLQLVAYNKPCPEPTAFGYFTDPTTRKTIKVADAGRARFWIEFELGKWLIPIIKNGNLEILNPEIVACAESDFDVTFAQGCTYF